MAESSKVVVRESWEHYQAGDFAASRRLFADRFVAHVAGFPNDIGIDEYAAQGSEWLAAFPDFVIDIEDCVAEGDRVVTRAVIRGTHQGELLGIPATGKRVNLPGILIDRVEEGKIVERWASWDLIGLMQQLGLMPSLAVVQSSPGRILLWLAVKGRSIVAVALGTVLAGLLYRRLRSDEDR